MSEAKDDTLATTAPQQALSVGDYRMTPEQVALIKRTIAKDCTDDELKLFVHVCRRLRLDPIAKQIYAVKYDGKMVIQTGIDGFRLIAQRTGKYKGCSDPEWCGEDGVWREVWTDMDTYPRAARVRVIRQGPDDLEPMVISGLANFSEYVALKDKEPNSRWRKAPAAMLAKCAEALALRRAFPDELSGLFSFDEMSSSYEKDPKQIAQPQRKSEKGKPATREDTFIPSASPWVGELDDVLPVGEPDSPKVWRLNADGGHLIFFTDQVDIYEKACKAMSDGKSVRIEWKKTSKGNAQVETLSILMDV